MAAGEHINVKDFISNQYVLWTFIPIFTVQVSFLLHPVLLSSICHLVIIQFLCFNLKVISEEPILQCMGDEWYDQFSH